MQLAETVKLYLTKEQENIIKKTMTTYIATVNSLLSEATNGISIFKYTSKDVKTELPSTLRCYCIRDAKSIIKKTKNKTMPHLHKPCCYINNQNFKIRDNRIEFPIFLDGRCQRISVETKMSDRQKSLFESSKLGTLRIVFKNKRIVAQVTYKVIEKEDKLEGNVMGVDLGIKCPAVSYISDGNIKFYGNGRKNKYIRRCFSNRRKKLQNKKCLKAVKRINNKEQRIMKDIDHKISREIVNVAVLHNVKTVKIERLANIRSTTRTSRKNNFSLHSWSFYRLIKFIEYKAKLVGISVEYINPSYTSQICPKCGRVHHAKDRNYKCNCGFKIHRDILGAINICNSTECVGGSNTRHTA